MTTPEAIDNVAQKLMYLAFWYSMPEYHLNTIKEAVKLLDRPRCSLKKCPFLDELTAEQLTEVEE